MTEHPSNSQPFQPGSNIALPLSVPHAINPTLFYPATEPFLQTDNCNQDFSASLDISPRFLTVHPTRNDSLSDDSYLEQTVIGSNENSIQPSPIKPNVVSQLSNPTSISPSHLLVNPILTPKQPSPTIVPTKRHPQTVPHNPGRTITEDEIDISSFIDNFLGSDELMENVPPVIYDPPAALNKHSTSFPHPQLVIGSAPSDAIPFSQPSIDENALQSHPPTASFGLNHAGTVLHRCPAENPTPTPHSCNMSYPIASPAPIAHNAPTTSTPVPPTTSAPIPPTPPPRRAEKRKPRTYSQAVPSQHCHICSRRPAEGSPHQVCGNLQFGRCRKTICTKCFHQFRWDLQAAREAPAGTWKCPHCRGQCPQRAQCVIYNRTSDRRRLKLINHRKRKREEDENKTEGDEVKKEEGKARKRRAGVRSDSPDSGKTEGGCAAAAAAACTTVGGGAKEVGQGAKAESAGRQKQATDGGKGRKGGISKTRKKGGKKVKAAVKEEAAMMTYGVQNAQAIGGGADEGRGFENAGEMGGGAKESGDFGSGSVMKIEPSIAIGAEQEQYTRDGVGQQAEMGTPGLELGFDVEGGGRGEIGQGERRSLFESRFEGSFNVDTAAIGKELGAICGMEEVSLVNVCAGGGDGQGAERGFGSGGMGIGVESLGMEQLWGREEGVDGDNRGGGSVGGGSGDSRGGSGGGNVAEIGRGAGEELWMLAEEESRDELLGLLGGAL